MNNSNLMPIQEVNSRRTREQHSEDSRRAGKASGEARRKKKAMKDAINMLLSLPLKDEKANAYLEYLGFEEEDMDNQLGLVISMYKEAVAKGNVQAANWIRDTAGDKPVEKVEANVENKNADISAIKDIANQMKDVDDIDVST